MELPPFRLGQITDLHARSVQPGSSQYVQRRCRDALPLFAEGLRRLKELAVDFVAVTGDLLDVPDYIVGNDDYYDYDRAQWAADIEADYRLVRSILDQSGLPYTVLPGNHDVPAILWRVFDPAANVIDVIDVKGYRIARFCDRERDKHVPRRIDRERKLWESLLADPNSPPQIHLQHYVVTPELNDWYPHTYLEGVNLRKRNVASGRVALCISGHYHDGTELIRDGGCVFSTSRALCEFPHPIRVYEIGPQIFQQTILLREQPLTARRKVVFLDRDGVINVQGAYNTGPEDIRLIPGAGKAIAQLHRAGYAVVVVTNQSAIGCGYVTPDIVHAVNDRICRLLRREAGEAAQPDAIFMSIGAGDLACAPEFIDQSDAKPATVLLDRAIAALKLDRRGGFFVGDRETDIQTAIRAGMTPILVRTGFGKDVKFDGKVFDDLLAAAGFIIGTGKSLGG